MMAEAGSRSAADAGGANRACSTCRRRKRCGCSRSRAPATRHGWPFSVDEGTLTCVWGGGQKVVIFFEGRPKGLDEDEDFEPRGVIVTTDPMQLTLGNIANRALFRDSR